jgi:Icc-related predicted phosphoesterase
MIIDCISDLHGHYPELPEGDLLIIAGDLTRNDSLTEVNRFKDWIVSISMNYKKIINIGGNHDNWVQQRNYMNGDPMSWESPFLSYLEDTGTEICWYPDLSLMNEGMVYERIKLKIWGSPWTLKFDGINPKCSAFTGTEEELAEKFALIPEGLDILITHSPLYGILDEIKGKSSRGKVGEHVGSKSLKNRIWNMENPPKIIIHGHIHEGYGEYLECWYECSNDHFHQRIINCSHVDENYNPVNKPMRIYL